MNREALKARHVLKVSLGNNLFRAFSAQNNTMRRFDASSSFASKVCDPKRVQNRSRCERVSFEEIPACYSKRFRTPSGFPCPKWLLKQSCVK
jgi:hypothetical protein